MDFHVNGVFLGPRPPTSIYSYVSRLIAGCGVYLSLCRGPTVHLINVSSILSISGIDPSNRCTTGTGFQSL